VDDSTHNTEGDKEEKGHEWPSVDVAKPIEEGGSVARKGFNYQDKIAASSLLVMMEDNSIVKIHWEPITIFLLSRPPRKKYKTVPSIGKLRPQSKSSFVQLRHCVSARIG